MWVVFFATIGIFSIRYFNPIIDYYSYSSSVRNATYFKDIDNDYASKYGIHSGYQWSMFLNEDENKNKIEDIEASIPSYEPEIEPRVRGRDLFAELKKQGTSAELGALLEENVKSFNEKRVSDEDKDVILNHAKNVILRRYSFENDIIPFLITALVLVGLQFLFLGSANPMKLKELSVKD